MEPDLTLDKAKPNPPERCNKRTTGNTEEATREESTLDAVNKKAPRRILLPIPPQPMPPRNCRRCGKGNHPKQSCPARDMLRVFDVTGEAIIAVSASLAE